MTKPDPIVDMLMRIRDAQSRNMTSIVIPASRLKAAIAKVLRDEGYIDNFHIRAEDDKNNLEIELKCDAGGRLMVDRIRRANQPPLRADESIDSIRRNVRLVTRPKAKTRSGKGYLTGHPASDSTRLPAATLSALSRALKRA